MPRGVLGSESSWSLRRPRHVQAAVLAATFAMLGGLALTLPWLALLMTAVAWRMRRHRYWGLYNPVGSLRASPAQWRLVDASGEAGLAAAQPIEAWQGPGWLVLRLRGLGPDGRPQQLDATVWRASLGARAWRQLQERIARLAERASIVGGAQ